MYHYNPSMYGAQCPEATQDPQINAENQRRTYQQYGYGPMDPANPEPGFWQDKAQRWGLPVLNASLRRCGNCGAFDITDDMVACGGASEDGSRGYCQGHHFTCSAMRTCDTWSPGGPQI